MERESHKAGRISWGDRCQLSPQAGDPEVTGSEVTTLGLAMTLSQLSSDMWSRNSSLVMPAQDTTTDGRREKQACDGEWGGVTHRETVQSRGPWRQHYRALKGRGRLAFTCTCSSRRLAALPRTRQLEGGVVRRAPSSLPGPRQLHRLPRRCLVRSQAATAAPSAARRTLTARPMPPPAPGTGEDKRARGRGQQGAEVVRPGPEIRATARPDGAPRTSRWHPNPPERTPNL